MATSLGCKNVMSPSNQVVVMIRITSRKWVVGKGGYSWSLTRTRIFLKYTVTFTKQLFFIPNVVFTAAFASRPRS